MLLEIITCKKGQLPKLVLTTFKDSKATVKIILRPQRIEDTYSNQLPYISALSSILHSSQKDFPGGSDCKGSAYNVGDPGLIPGLGRSPGEGNRNPLQQSCLENPMDGGAWQATVQGVAKSRTQLSDLTSLGA